MRRSTRYSARPRGSAPGSAREQLADSLGQRNPLALREPAPASDGAALLFERLSVDRLSRIHADVAKLLPITYGVVMLLIIIGLSTMYLDIVNPVTS